MHIRFHYKTTGSGSWSSTQAVTPTQTAAPTPQCTGGQTMQSGSCQCPSGTSMQAGSCQTPPQQQASCQQGSTMQNGQCVLPANCPAGTTEYVEGKATAPNLPGYRWVSGGADFWCGVWLQ